MAAEPVVVGVDGSEESLLAAEWAAMEAKRRGLPLRIVSAPAMMPRMIAHPDSSAALATVLRAVASRALEAACGWSGEVAPGLPVETRLLSGPPALAVSGCGSDASLLVVGARGAGVFAAMILGSESRSAAARAPCPVVVVRQQNTAVHGEIAVGVGDPQDSTATVAFAFEEAAIRRADLVVVHAWQGLPSAPHPPADRGGAVLPRVRPGQVSAEAAGSLSATLDGWRNQHPDVRVRQDVIRGHPAHVLVSYSARADLVVLGRHANIGAGCCVGSIRHAVLDHAHGPVAVVPSAARRQPWTEGGSDEQRTRR